MKTYTKTELLKIFRLHQLWVNNEKGGKRADLSDSDLRGSDLSYSNLRGSDLSGSNLSYSDLSYSDLSGSDLSYSDLSDSDLSYSNLRGSDLSYSNLRGSDLSGSNLSYSDLRGSDLRGSKTDQYYIQISCIGSRKGTTLYCYDTDTIWCGCFKGTLVEFESRCEETHKNNPQFLAEYRAAITLFKSLKKDNPTTEEEK